MTAEQREDAAAPVGELDEKVGRMLAFRDAVRSVDGRILVVGHNYPDPDCLASGMAMRALLAHACDRESDFAFGGRLGRAANRAMVGVLDMPWLSVDGIDPDDYEAVITVDTQPGSGNNTIPESLPVLGVFDHHSEPDLDLEAVFPDVRTGYGATSTIVTEYIEAAGVAIPPRLATALFLGIRTDTEDLERDVGDADIACYMRLFPLVDRKSMLQVMRPPLSEEYFGMLRRALNSARRYDDVVIADLREVHAPDLLSEVSELFVQLKGVEWSLALGSYQGMIHLSLRGAKDRSNAAAAIRKMENDHTRVGGHGRAAGGTVDPEGGDADAATERFVERFLKNMQAGGVGPRPVCIEDGTDAKQRQT